MQFDDRLPDRLVACFRLALLGEFYPIIRAIAVGYNQVGSVLILSYLDREPNNFDYESIDVVAVNFDVLGAKGGPVTKIDVDCVYAEGPHGNFMR